MSAGGFKKSKYEADSGDIHLIKIQEETLEATIGGSANSAPAGGISSPFAAEVNRGARSYGLRPRYITVAFEDDAPEGYRPYTTLTIPILESDLFESIEIDDAVVYNGGNGKVTNKVGEDIRPGEAVVTDDGGTPEEPAPQ